MECEAKDCNDCLSWHHHCMAECCKVMRFNTALAKKPRVGQLLPLTLERPIDADMRWYLEMHGGRVEGNTVTFRLVKFQWDKRTGRLLIFRTCDLLQDDFKCESHPDLKPDVCQKLVAETAKNPDYYITPNCLFKHKEDS